LGNSHVAALKRAWDYMATDHPNCEVHFIARPHGQGGLRGLEIKEGILSPANNEKGFMFSNNKAGFVDLSVYDALIIVGCFPFVSEMDRYSSQVLAYYAKIRFSRSRYIFHDIASRIREACDSKILWVSEPFPAENPKK
jgi:hypothetical protein